MRKGLFVPGGAFFRLRYTLMLSSSSTRRAALMGGRIQGVLGNAVSSEAEDWSGHSLQHQQPGKGPAMEMNCLSPALRINQTISLEDSGTNSLRGERSSVDLDTRSNVPFTDPKAFFVPYTFSCYTRPVFAPVFFLQPRP